MSLSLCECFIRAQIIASRRNLTELFLFFKKLIYCATWARLSWEARIEGYGIAGLRSSVSTNEKGEILIEENNQGA